MENFTDNLPITERINEITRNIDLASSREMIEMLKKSDEEIYTQSQGLLNEAVLDKVARISDIAANLLRRDRADCGVVLSGCGTSGRLAFMTATNFNKHLKSSGRKLFKYLIAGGDRSLFTSQELSEDIPQIGVKDLIEATSNLSSVLYIGITCGLSAAYIAGQLQHCLDHPDKFKTIVLIGFNPVELARDNKVEGWEKTFRQVTMSLVELDKARNNQAIILNPIIGSEPICGSTRMKSGTATKVLLDVMFSQALDVTIGEGYRTVKDRIEQLRDIDLSTYDQSIDSLSSVIDIAGTTLRNNGRIVYISDHTSLGLVTLIDASECTPTYGCDDITVRSYVTDGYQGLGLKQDNKKKIDLDDFLNEDLSKLDEKDLMIIVTEGTSFSFDKMEKLHESSPQKTIIQLFPQLNQSHQNRESFKLAIQQKYPSFSVIQLSLPSLSAQEPSSGATSQAGLSSGATSQAGLSSGASPRDELLEQSGLELMTKLTCNMITTGAFIKCGKVCDNLMIDLKIRNNKLYYRALRIIENFGKCDEKKAENCLLRSIYGTDELDLDLLNRPISEHIVKATSKNKVVPQAIVMARLECTFSEAADRINSTPVIRQLFS